MPSSCVVVSNSGISFSFLPLSLFTPTTPFSVYVSVRTRKKRGNYVRFLIFKPNVILKRKEARIEEKNMPLEVFSPLSNSSLLHYLSLYLSKNTFHETLGLLGPGGCWSAAIFPLLPPLHTERRSEVGLGDDMAERIRGLRAH